WWACRWSVGLGRRRARRTNICRPACRPSRTRPRAARGPRARKVSCAGKKASDERAVTPREEELPWPALRRLFVRPDREADGTLRSPTFPGLWLDAQALMQLRMPRVLEVLRQGLASPEHAAFVAKLQQAAAGKP